MEFIIVNFVKVYSDCHDVRRSRNQLIEYHISSFSLGKCFLKKLLININIVKTETKDRVYELIEDNLIKITEKESGNVTQFENNLKFKLDWKAKVLVPESKIKEKLFGLGEIEKKVFPILNRTKYNELLFLYGPDGCGKRSLINNLELDIENKTFYKYNQEELEEDFKYLDKKIIGSSCGIVLSLRLDNSMTELFKSRLCCWIKRLLGVQGTSIKIVLILKDIQSFPLNFLQLSWDKYFVRSLFDEEKAEFLQLLTGRNDCVGEFDALSKSLPGFTASEIKQFVNRVKLLDPNLSVKSLLECAEKDRFIPERLSKLAFRNKQLRWSDIGGYESVKRWLQIDVVIPLRTGKAPIKGVLFHGPPGCSKTMFVQALATECNLRLFALSSAALMRSVVGESEKILSEYIDQAVASTPSILFIDEIDLVLANDTRGHSSVTDHLLNQLMAFLNSSHRVLFVATTNCIDNLNQALIRPGRIDQIINIDLPDQESREAILKIIFSDQRFAIGAGVMENLSSFAGRLHHRSGADIQNFGKAVKQLAEKEFSQKNESLTIGKPIIRTDHVIRML